MRLLDGQVATPITLAGAIFLANAHPFLTQVPCNIVAIPSTFSLDNTNRNTVNGCFVGFDVEEPSSRQVVTLGKLSGIRFMSIFRFNLWWSSFGTSLQPGVGDNVDICVESGSTKVCESSFRSCVYMHVGDDPYNLVNEAMKVARLHLGSFRLMDEKRSPGIVDKFGWCTWDAFYRNVNPKGVWDGVKALQEAGCAPGMLIIDDGWQSICIDDDPIEKEGIDRAAVGEEKPYRLAVCNIVRDRVGLVPTELAHQMYEGLHSQLKSVGIHGVKIDVIEVLELLSEDYGGRVELAKAYYNARMVSLRKHFNGNAAISSMQQASDFFFLGTETIALGRVGDDFWHNDPFGDPTGGFWLQAMKHGHGHAIRGCHMVHCAYNSLWMGNFILPDWDMFQSYHQCAELHAASRALSGGPIYVSDSVGKYNFNLLRKVALPDGSILRCEHYALPTRDCLFEDPLHDSKTALKIWNLNKFSGVLGIFNCQGGGWCPGSRKIKSFPEFAVLVDCFASPKDVEWSNGKNPIFVEVKEAEAHEVVTEIKVTLEPLKFELLIVSPVKILPQKQIQIAPIGLVNMLNSGGTIQSLAFDVDKNVVRIGVKGRGELRVFASEKPWGDRIDGRRAEFGYDEQMVTTEIPWVNSTIPLTVEYCF
ncbi:hypothetical protein J1N35_014493 [Gossypium stocksii]|uniref:galactinol--sucrose galactosyltransferase n=1 Tax=Gossypium stocksii TaxID=47602 RepID=A0A9D3VV26_9ROSI|nr:hypothetical protein J1N35_014493 [Gossypium stocksii]